MTHVIESSLSGQVEKYHLRTISACSCFHPSTAGFSFFSSLVFNLLTPELNTLRNDTLMLLALCKRFMLKLMSPIDF